MHVCWEIFAAVGDTILSILRLRRISQRIKDPKGLREQAGAPVFETSLPTSATDALTGKNKKHSNNDWWGKQHQQRMNWLKKSITVPDIIKLEASLARESASDSPGSVVNITASGAKSFDIMADDTRMKTLVLHPCFQNWAAELGLLDLGHQKSTMIHATALVQWKMHDVLMLKLRHMPLRTCASKKHDVAKTKHII